MSLGLALCNMDRPSIEELIRFGGPAYTYVLKLPLNNWQNVELALQHSFSPIFGDNIDDPQVFSVLDSCDDLEKINFYRTYNEARTFIFVLTDAAHKAAKTIFQRRQGSLTPVASIYAQGELGQQQLHVHLVLAGLGLNKHTAKQWRHQLATEWIQELWKPLRETARIRPVDPETKLMLELAEASLTDMSGGKVCSILQYRARDGSMYACRVDAVEYICNYLLPKNFKYYSFIDPLHATVTMSQFLEIGADKTYGATLLNGALIPFTNRKDWVNQLQQHNIKNLTEPVFSGDLFGELPEVSRAIWKGGGQSGGKMTKKETLMIDCLRRCHEKHLLTYEDLVNECPDLLIMIESQSSGQKLLEQTLNMMHIKLTQSHTAFTFIKARYNETTIESTNRVFKLLMYQGYNAWQVGHWLCCVLDKKAGKQNSISFFGPASTGKTNLAKAIVNCVKLYGNVNHLNKNFVFNDCAAKLIIWWEEALMHTDYVEQAKCLLGGTEFRIDRKHKDSQVLPQTPVLISTNNNIYEVTGGNTVSNVHAKPLRERIVQLNLMKQLPATFGEITPSEVAAWLLACANRFTLTLESFYRQWNLTVVPNDFPLTEPCVDHSQDFTLDDCGICDTCGCYKPLDVDWIGTLATSPGKTLTGTPFKILTPTKIHFWCTEFDLSYLDSPAGPSRKRDTSTPISKPSTQLDLPSPAAPKKARQKLSFKQQVLDRWCAQPRDELETKLYEEEIQSIWPSPEKQESLTTKKGLTPTEWGEKLGVQTQGFTSSPIVLHCFETIPESEDDSD